MQTISIETIANTNGERVYRAAIGDSRAAESNNSIDRTIILKSK